MSHLDDALGGLAESIEKARGLLPKGGTKRLIIPAKASLIRSFATAAQHWNSAFRDGGAAARLPHKQRIAEQKRLNAKVVRRRKVLDYINTRAKRG